jgi:beta-glucosidase-like glycosyl hydrolase
MCSARLRALGINLDFAPVCDVNNNPQNRLGAVFG